MSTEKQEVQPRDYIGEPFVNDQRETVQRITLNDAGDWFEVVVKPGFGRMRRFQSAILKFSNEEGIDWIGDITGVMLIHFCHAWSLDGKLDIADLAGSLDALDALQMDEVNRIQEVLEEAINPLLTSSLNRMQSGSISGLNRSARRESAKNGRPSS